MDRTDGRIRLALPTIDLLECKKFKGGYYEESIYDTDNYYPEEGDSAIYGGEIDPAIVYGDSTDDNYCREDDFDRDDNRDDNRMSTTDMRKQRQLWSSCTKHLAPNMIYLKNIIKIALCMLLVLNADSSKAYDTIDTNIRDSVTCNIIRSEKSIDVIRAEGHGTIKDYEKLTTKASAEKIEEVRVMAARQFLKDKGEDKLRKIISEYGLLSAYFIFYISHTGEIVAISIGFPNENANDREKFPDMMFEEIFVKIADCIRFPSWDSKPLYTSFATGITY